MSRIINLGGTKLRLETEGVDEALEKLNLLIIKLKEAKSLLNEIASMDIDIKFNDFDRLIND